MADEFDEWGEFATPKGAAPGRPWPSMVSWFGLRMLGLAFLLGLFALWVPGAMEHGRSSRRAAERAGCLRNLKQIAWSIGWYSQRSEGTKGEGTGPYPPGTIQDPTIPLERRCGWASLTYLINDEGCSGCPAVHPELAWDDPRQQPLTGRESEMYCPSCPKPSATRPLVPAAYIGIAGLGVDAPGLPTSDPRAGIFGDGRVVTPADVTDGLAGTMMVVESSEPAGPWFAGGRNTVRGLDPARKPYIGQGRQFGGNHAGGVQVLMADGAVRFVKDSAAPKIFEGLSTIAGGEKVSVP